MLYRRIFAVIRPHVTGRRRVSAASTTTENETKPEEFRVLTSVWPPKENAQRAERFVQSWKKNIPQPRALRMSTDQDWKSVWPSAKMFNPAVVPLPIHMGYVHRKDNRAPPDKWANAELMKIPNFLHLSPPAIKAHCKALKKFCTPWPKELTTDEECFKHFPFEYIFSDYVHAAPTIRDVRARVVKLHFKLSALPLDYHAKDKMKRILNSSGEKKYNEDRDMVTVVADRCPLKMQNYDFINYLVTACFFESWKTEAWEEEMERSDWERYYFEKSRCFSNLLEYVKRAEQRESVDASEVLARESVQAYGEAVTRLFDEGENEESIEQYKESVLKLLFKETEDVRSDQTAKDQKDDPST